MILKKIFLTYHPETLVLITLVLTFFVRDPESPYDKMIVSDGKGYYAYLPAVFIHHNFTYSFVEDYEKTHYQQYGTDFFEFRIRSDGHVTNKYFPGVAILWIPFFLAAHLFALAAGFPADGYSLPYQVAIGLAAIFYLWFGLRALRKILLSFGFSETLILVTTWFLYAGTNLIYYTIEEPSFTHVYSFTLVNLFVLSVIRLANEYRSWYLYAAALLLAMIIIIRPVNGLIILIVPFAAGSWQVFQQLIKRTLKDHKHLGVAAVAGFVVISLVPVLWKIQSGNWFLYTYGNEGFDFSGFHLHQVLLSYRNGWWVYTPLAAIAFIGLEPLYKASQYRALALLGFTLVTLYFLSAWSVWWYGEAYGFRPAIEFYFILAILLAFLLRWISTNRLIYTLTVVLFLLLSVFNFFKMWQYQHGILPAKHLDRQTYWNNFFATIPQARAYVDKDKILVMSRFYTDMETDPGWLNYASASTERAFSGKYSSKLDSINIYSVGFNEDASILGLSHEARVLISAMVYSEVPSPTINLVVDFFDLNNQSISYQRFYLRDYIPAPGWIWVEFLAPCPKDAEKVSRLGVYFWNPPSAEVVFVDDFSIMVIEELP